MAADFRKWWRIVEDLDKLKHGGHKKARLLVQPGFFRDPVGIRTPNLRIRSAMLYPVELQSR